MGVQTENTWPAWTLFNQRQLKWTVQKVSHASKLLKFLFYLNTMKPFGNNYWIKTHNYWIKTWFVVVLYAKTRVYTNTKKVVEYFYLVIISDILTMSCQVIAERYLKWLINIFFNNNDKDCNMLCGSYSIVMNLQRIITLQFFRLRGFQQISAHCLNVWLQLYCAGSLLALSQGRIWP